MAKKKHKSHSHATHTLSVKAQSKLAAQKKRQKITRWIGFGIIGAVAALLAVGGVTQWLLPVYLLQSPAPEGNVTLPYRSEPEVDLSEGPHLGYALQWFAFAITAGVIYLALVRSREKKAERVASGREAPRKAAQQPGVGEERVMEGGER